MEREGPRERIGRSVPEKSTGILTIFVANIPVDLDIFGLKGIFSVAGEVSVVSIPLGQRGRRKFGFVRFKERASVGNSIRLLNGKIVRGNRIVVQEARSEKRFGNENRFGKYPRPDIEGRTIKNPIFGFAPRTAGRNGRSNHRFEGTRNLIVDSKELRKGKELRKVIGVANNKHFEWLINSLFGESDEFCDLAELNSWLVREVEGLVRVKKLQWNQYLLQFESVEAANRELQNSTKLKEIFHNLRSWSWYDVCSSRPVWLEVMGVPPLGWKTSNFNQMVGVWGNFVCLGKDLSEVVCYDSMKILIITNILERIDEHIIFDLEGKGFKVHIKEVDSWSLVEDMSGIIPKLAYTPEASEIQVGNVSNGIPDIAEEGVMVQNQVLSNHSLAIGEDVVTLGNQIIPGLSKIPEVESFGEDSISEGTNTSSKINDIEDSISNNTRVEETQFTLTEKTLGQNVGESNAFNDTEINIEKPTGTSEKEDINGEKLISGNNTISEEEAEEMEEIQGNIQDGPEIAIQKRKKKIEAKKKKTCPKIGRANRFYESAKRVREASKKVVEGTYDSTPESIKEKAKKAVEFGNRVGLKARQNVDGAIRRITNSLKD